MKNFQSSSNTSLKLKPAKVCPFDILCILKHKILAFQQSKLLKIDFLTYPHQVIEMEALQEPEQVEP